MADEPDEDVRADAPQPDRVTDSAARIIAADEAQPHGELPDPRDDYPNPAGGFLTLFWTPRPPRRRPSAQDEPWWSDGVVLVVGGGLLAVAILWAVTQLL